MTRYLLPPLFLLTTLLFSVSSGELVYKQVAVKSSCKGQFTYKGYVADLEGCGQACNGSAEMFLYGTNLYGNNRCTSTGCRCYCALTTTNGRCNQRTSHRGYILYSYIKGVANIRFASLKTASKCSGCETYKGEMTSARECFLACKATADAFAFGTKSSGKNPCLCQDNTKVLIDEYGVVDRGVCREAISDTTFNLYSIEKVRYFRIKDWRIDGKGNRECNGGETDKGKKDTPKDCADACRGISGMFAFGPSPNPQLGICTKNCKCKCLHNTMPICSRNYVRDYGYLLYSVYGKGYRHHTRKGMCSASTGTSKGYMATYKMCGEACEGYSMFRFGTKRYEGRSRAKPRTPNTCTEKGCHCVCENDTKYRCKSYKYSTNYTIYTFVGKRKISRDD